jgi:hypothetical protein
MTMAVGGASNYQRVMIIHGDDPMHLEDASENAEYEFNLRAKH